MPHKIRVEDKEVSSAIEKGLKKLGLRRDQVEVTVLESPRKGFLGIGARPAVVELRQKRWVSDNLDAQIYMDLPKKKRSSGRGRGGKSSRSRKGEDCGVREIKRGGRRAYGARHSSVEKTPKANEPQLLPNEQIQHAVIPDFLKAPLQEAKDYLANVLEHMGVKVENLNAWWDEKQHRILLTFDCDHPAIVIGKEGKTLESLQYLATLSVSRHFDKPISVIADTQNYWRKAEDKINADLEYGINQIKNGYSVYRFRPMSAQLRRYIHRAAENNEFVITVSEGEGQWRKVTLRPRPADQPVQQTASTVAADVQPVAAEAQPQENASAAADVQPSEQTAPVAETAAAPVETPSDVTANTALPEAELAAPANQSVQQAATDTQAPQPEQPVVEAVQAPRQEAAPAAQAQAEQPASEEAAPTAHETQDAAAVQNGNCQNEIACNCSEAETQNGCACGPLFEPAPKAEEEQKPQGN